MTKALLTALFVTGFCSHIVAQNVSIPDAAFKNLLLSDYLINTNGDNEIQLSEATAYHSMINCNVPGISDMTGIEAFVNISRLYSFGGTFSSIDLSNNTSLIEIAITSNPNITSLDVSQNTNLIILNVTLTGITGLDLTHNPALEELIIFSMPITAIDVSQNPALKMLWCSNTGISELDLGQNPALEYLNLDFTDVTQLDLTNNIALKSLSFVNDGFTEIDLSHNTMLEVLNCGGNLLSELNLEANAALIDLKCGGNILPELDLSHNTALKFLWCGGNPLTALNLTANVAIREVYADICELASLNVSSCQSLNILSCAHNQLTALDLGGNPYLRKLWCHNNQLSALDLSTHSYLKELMCNDNRLTDLDISNGSNHYMQKYGPETGDWEGEYALHTDNNPDLLCIEVDDALWSAQNFNFIDDWTGFSIECNWVASVNENASDKITIYPNPFTDTITLQGLDTNARISIYDMKGALVHSGTHSGGTIDLAALSSGAYVMKIVTDAAVDTKKIIKE